jgi:hypothetical protein
MAPGLFLVRFRECGSGLIYRSDVAIAAKEMEDKMSVVLGLTLRDMITELGSLVAVLAPLVVLVVECLTVSDSGVLCLGIDSERTLGKVTLGMMTTFNAEGASFLGALRSPPGWYWYLPSPPPSFQGSLSSACAMVRCDEELVGFRAAECQ